jgi:very-long-chain enoyl-CoA reductase
MAESKPQSKAGPPPRAHNVTSYLVTLIVFPAVVYYRAHALSGAVVLPMALWSFHFARRTLESLALHRYGKPAVPWSDAIQEYLYYWGFAGWTAWWMTREGYAVSTGSMLYAGLALYGVGELGNLATHVMLARLRPKGGKERVIPRGFLFELVSCPNYLFEILTWLGFALVADVRPAWAFFVVGTLILADWARKRHAAYLEQFKDYPKKRKRLLPLVF